MRRLGRAGIGLIVVVVAGMTVWGVHEFESNTSPKIYSLNTSFAGYDLTGMVHEINATIVVPRTYSPDGIASSWVGLQQCLTPPFVQVGVIELGTDTDELFWSSNTAGFHPQLIGPATPGEVVTFAISRDVRHAWHWHVSGAGLTARSGVFAEFHQTSFSRAEWFQEDPATPPIGVSDTYPLFGDTITFQRLGWNDTTPSLTLANARMMFPHDGPIEVPSRVVRDAFTLLSPIGRAATYAKLAQLFDNRLFDIGYDLRYWSGVDPARRRRDIVNYIADISSLDDSLSTLRWSPTTSYIVRQHAANGEKIIIVLRQWRRQGLTKTDSAYGTLTRLESSRRVIVNALRRSLGLPPS